MFTTPGGNPASSTISAIRSPPETGEYSEGFTTTVQPATSGFKTARHGRIWAAFHGVKLATTPSGRRIAIEWVFGTFDTRTSPFGR